MSTSAATFERIIFNAISDNVDGALIEKLYTAVRREVTLDDEDVLPTSTKGKRNADLAWKRNMRNKLQQLKNLGRLVNDEREHWRLPTQNPKTTLELEEAWANVHHAAKKARDQKVVWTSPKADHHYSILEATENMVRLELQDGTKPIDLRPLEVKHAITYLNAAGGRMGRGTLNIMVAKEAAIVFLHPALRWTSDFEHIEVLGSIGRPDDQRPMQELEPGNDNPDQRQAYSRRVRKGQPELRKRLLKLYQSKCCISGTGPSNVLQAAHIEAHAIQGLNTTTNGLLLRSDLHDLFDDGLLAIDPVTLAVWIHSSLKGTHYAEFQGKLLRPRSDGRRPDQVRLETLWRMRSGPDTKRN